MVLWWAAGSWYRVNRLEQEGSQLSRELTPRVNSLTNTVNARAALLKGLDACARAHPTEEELPPEFSDFAAALYAREHPRSIRMLLTDVVMPEMGGRDLAEKIQEGHPGILALFVSGYTDNAIVHQGVLETGIAFLPRPYSSRALAAKVREVLDGKT